MNSNPSARDIAWNYASTAAVGILGVALPLVVGAWYGVASLGVFNKVFALYIIFSQVAVFGVHLSVLKYATEESAKEDGNQYVLWGALVAFLPVASCIALSMHTLAPLFAKFMDSPSTGHGMRWAAGGVFFFAANKILLSFLNAQTRLRAYAFYNALRYALMMASLIFLWLSGARAENIPALFLMAEGALFCFLTCAVRRSLLLPLKIEPVLSWAKQHLWFGLRSVGGHIMLDMNNRIDVICLGFLADDATVGVYSMAAILTEAAYQFSIVLRTVYTPRQIILLYQNNIPALQALVKRLRTIIWGVLGIAAFAAAFVYPHLIPWLTGRPEYADGTVLFAILMAGMVVGSGYAPFGLLLVNAGHPAKQTMMITFLVVQNLLGILLLVPFLGSMGAALSTSLAYAAPVVLLKYFVRKNLKFTI